MNRLTVLRRVFYILGITSLLSACNETDNLVLKSPDGKIQQSQKMIIQYHTQ